MRKCVSGCMSKDTRIMMGDGNEKIITDIRLGDVVLLSSGKTDRISDIFTGNELEMLVIKIDNSSLVVSANHPMLSEGGKWVRAADLKVGDTVCIQNGLAKVISIQCINYQDNVYNICLFVGEDGIYANGFIVGDMVRQNRMCKKDERELDHYKELMLRCYSKE